MHNSLLVLFIAIQLGCTAVMCIKQTKKRKIKRRLYDNVEFYFNKACLAHKRMPTYIGIMSLAYLGI